MIDFILKFYTDRDTVIYHFIMLVGVLIGLKNYNKLNYSSKIMFLLLCITPFVELTASYVGHVIKNNNSVYNPFTIVQFFLVNYAFYKDTGRKLYLHLFILLMVFAIVNGIKWEPFFTKWNNNTYLLSSLFIIIGYFLFLIQYVKTIDNHKLRDFPIFWIGTGWMIFSIASIVALGFVKLYTTGSIWDNISTYTRQVSNYLLYLSFIPAFLSPQKSLNNIARNQ